MLKPRSLRKDIDMKVGNSVTAMKFREKHSAVTVGMKISCNNLVNMGWRLIIPFGKTDLFFKPQTCYFLLWSPSEGKITFMFIGDESYLI